MGVRTNDGDTIMLEPDTTMAEQEAKLQSKYGNLPVFTKSLLGHQRKYFDSGDYALSKAGKEATVGSEHPQPENIPHSIPLNPIYGSVPSRRGSLVIMAMQANGAAEQHAL
ncbi:hypothetical protein BGX21_006648 [Mortierella sp. AD011]|nr:hypothetical protein BGX20_006570 [Mortierella sp. AD010]KAF9399197.1 hypothetical protein BGX21_006648 [Mortierella sp. AD011]KAG0002271.1 hypothetical protein BGZ79_003286 [Entomortierella chlamydospora]